MVNTLPDDADTITLASASRPKNDVAIAREVAEIFGHMLGDGCSVLDPATTI